MPGPGYGAPMFVLIPRSVARTSWSTPRTVHRFPSGPGGLDYGDAERARQECFGELEHKLTDMTQDAAEAEMHHDHISMIGKWAAIVILVITSPEKN